jgi:hypothetical protein
MENIEIILNDKNEKNFIVVFGNKPFDNCFDFSLSEEKYVKFLRFIKNDEKWNLVSKKNIKQFYYYDIKLIIDDKSNMSLEKNIINKYYDIMNSNNNGIRIINYKKMDLDLNIFPGLDKINDIKKIREIIFEKNDIIIKFMVINHSNKEITFEMFIEFTNDNKNVSKELSKILDLFKYEKLTNYTIHKIENNDKLALSII